MILPVLQILFAALFTVAVATSLGALLVRRLRLEFRFLEGELLSFVTGSAMLSLLMFGLCALRLVRPWTLAALGAAIIGAGLLFGKRRQPSAPLPSLSRFQAWLFWPAFVFFAGVYLIYALAPEISADGATYHLGYVARDLANHGFSREPYDMYANLSRGVELLFLFAFAFGRHSAAGVVHYAFLLALPLLMVCYARRSGLPAAGVLGGLLVFLAPVAGVDGTSAYVDVAASCVAFALFYVLQIWDQERSPGLLVLAGLLAGFCYAIKYTVFVAVPFACGFVAWKLLRKKEKIVRPLAVVLACAMLMVLPWVVKNWIWLGNPFSPFMNRYFPNPYVYSGFEKSYRRYLQRYELDHLGRLPLELTVQGWHVQGIFGPVFLLSPLALLALRRREGRQLLLAGAVFASTYPSNVGARFLLTVAPFVALAFGMIAGRSRALTAALIGAHAILSWPTVIPLYAENCHLRLGRPPWKAALRLQSEEAYLSKALPGYRIAREIEERVPPSRRVFAVSMPPWAYTSREVLGTYQSARNHALLEILWSPLAEHYQPKGRIAFRFPAARYSGVRVMIAAEEAPEGCAINELQIFSEGREIPRSHLWRLRAHPNPWEVQSAFDNSLVTRWRVWEAGKTDMRLEADFGTPLTLDSVLLTCACDYQGLQVRLQGKSEGGDWVDLDSRPQRYETELPSGLRRAAVLELKAQGVDHLVLTKRDYYADDFRKWPEVWGIRLVAEDGDWWLYQIVAEPD